MTDTLTPKQKRFVEEYLIDWNGKQAAIRAGYSEKTAEVQASRLLSHAKVRAAVEKAQEARTKRTQIDSDWVLKRLVEEATADIADIYDDNGNLKPVKEWPLIWRQGLVTGVETMEEYETVNNEKKLTGFVKRIKQSERIKRLELIGKHVNIGAFADKVDHGGSIDIGQDAIAAALNRIAEAQTRG